MPQCTSTEPIEDVVLCEWAASRRAAAVCGCRRLLHAHDKAGRVADVAPRRAGPPPSELVVVVIAEPVTQGRDPRGERSPLAVPGPRKG